MKKLSALALTASLYLTTAIPASAEVNIAICPDAATNSNFSALCDITADGTLFSTIITVAFVIATLLTLVFLIYGGIKWITSGGDKAGVESARNMIVASLIGLVIVFLSYFILNLVLGFFGVTSTNDTFTLPTLSAPTTSGN